MCVQKDLSLSLFFSLSLSVSIYIYLYRSYTCLEPDHGMEPGLAQHFFLQLLSGVVSYVI